MTSGLARRFGAARVFDTLLDEQSILGLALGAGLAGPAPVPEIQYLAYLHNAEDQLRGEAATLPFFSRGRVPQPMVVRVAGLAYQRASAGTSTTTTRSACCATSRAWWSPARPAPTTRPRMLRTCVAAAIERRHGVGVPGADRALPQAGPVRDGRRRRGSPPIPARHAPIGRARVYTSRAAGACHSHHLRQRGADEPAGGPAAGRDGIAAGCSTCAGWPRCRWPTCWRPCGEPAGCWSWTRPGSRAGSARA